MKNNGFKKIIRDVIDNECNLQDLVAVYVDISNNSRMIYLYGLDWSIIGTISLWLNNETVHISASKNTNKPVSIVNYDEDLTVSYMEFERVIRFIEKFVDSL